MTETAEHTPRRVKAAILRALAGSAHPRLEAPNLAHRFNMTVEDVKAIATAHGGIEQPTRLLKAAQALEQQNSTATPPPVPVAASAPQVSRPPAVERPAGAATAPPPLQAAPPPGSVELLLARADKSSKARTRAAAGKVRNLLADLTDRVETEAAERREKARLAEERRQAEAAAREERERARAEVEVLKKKLAKAQAKLRGAPATKTTTDDAGPSSKEIRTWARAAGVDCPATGRVPQHVRDAYTAAHQDGAA